MTVLGGAAVLAVEDSGDGVVGVVRGQPADEVDGVFAGADGGWLAFDRHGQFGDRAAFPAQDQFGSAVGVVAVDGDVEVVEQGAQQLFAVFVGGARGVPDRFQVIT